MCIDVLWHATFPQRWSKSSVDSAVAGPLLSHWSSLWSLKGMTRELEKKKHEASMANQHMLTRVHPGTHTHTRARARASCPSNHFLTLSFSLARRSVHTRSGNTQTCHSWGLVSHWGHTRGAAAQSFTVLQRRHSSSVGACTKAFVMCGLALTYYTHPQLICTIHAWVFKCQCI